MSVMGPLPYNSSIDQYGPAYNPLQASRYATINGMADVPQMNGLIGPTPLSHDTVSLTKPYDISNWGVSSAGPVTQTRPIEKTSSKRKAGDDDAIKPTPDDTLTKFKDLNPERVQTNLGPVRGMLFDVDDTLSKFSFGGKRTIPDALVTQLKDLQESGIRLGIVSNNPNTKAAKQFQAELEKKGIHMDVVTHADKPNPEGLKLLQQKFGIPANQMVMVGDQPTDVEAGQNAGFKTIQVDWFGESKKHKKMIHKLDEGMLKADKAKGLVDSQSNLNYFPALNQPEVAVAG